MFDYFLFLNSENVIGIVDRIGVGLRPTVLNRQLLRYAIIVLDRCFLFDDHAMGHGRYVRGIVVQREATEAAVEYLNQIENEPGSDFGQRAIFFDNLIVAKPNAVVAQCKVEYVVDEGLAFRVVTRRAHCLREQLLEQLQIRLLVEVVGERYDRSGAFEAVAGHFQLFHSVQVFQVEFGRRTMWQGANPQIGVLFAVHFDVHDLVAVFHFGDFGDFVQAAFVVELAVGLDVRHEFDEILHGVASQIAHAT